MKTKLAFTLLVMAAVSINLYAATSALPAPLPDFMDQAQLAKWNADRSVAQTTTSSTPETANQFYTGKPYVADAGGYIYKYRTYNPEMSRWTSADPSGFPDGPNDKSYAPIPTAALDPLGLATNTQTYSLAVIPTSEMNTLASNAINNCSFATTNQTVINGIISAAETCLSGINTNYNNFTITASGTYNDSTDTWSTPADPVTGPGSGGTKGPNTISAGVSGAGWSGTASISYSLSTQGAAFGPAAPDPGGLPTITVNGEIWEQVTISISLSGGLILHGTASGSDVSNDDVGPTAIVLTE